MKKFCTAFLFAALSLWQTSAWANDTVFVHQPEIPILIERSDNVLYYLRIDAKSTETLNEIVLKFDKKVDLNQIESIKLYYGGTEARQDYGRNRFAPVSYVSGFAPGKTLAANTSYSIIKSQVNHPMRTVKLTADQKLFPGVNYFWVSIQMNPKAPVLTTLNSSITEVIVDNKKAITSNKSDKAVVRRMGVGVRHAGDDGSAAFRIPGIVTSNEGTLLGVYDVRYNSSIDLQEYVDVGLSRSTDKGQTWEEMTLPLAFGETGGLPAAQNGVGDPAILVDKKTNTIWVIAAWTHGMGNKRAWFSSQPGLDKEHTAQLILTKSEDDGKTWSDPINITEQVKDPSWYFLLQGPGMGITMQDGTLVFPIQYIDSTRVPNAGIMYSKDSGNTWKIHNHARTNTTEAQVAEVAPGVLMLNMRDNRGGSRAVATTTDLGKTWTEHSSSRGALPESVCMASLINVPAKDNALKKDILLFSNPNTTKGRHHITIKASLDGGVTWLPENQLLLDEEDGWGYTCLTMIDKETVGIFYESSVAHMTFQAIPLKDIVK